MDSGAIKKPIGQFLKAIPKKITIDKILIFGSQSSNTNSKDSDIDILVISSSFKKMNEDERLDILYKASRFIKPEIHPWGVTQDELEKASALTTIGDAREKGTYLKI